MTKAHAKLSASGAYRWMACTPSANLESEFPDKSSEFAQEGTFAHEFAELLLGQALGLGDKREIKHQIKRATKDKYYSQELADYVNGGYVSYVLEQANGLPSDAQIMLEQRLDFSEWVPEGFGTGDVVMVYDDTIEVIDLKYGKGVAVSAEGNPQMRLYALGALSLFADLYDIEKVRMTIVQPRLDSISTDELTTAELLAWAEDEVKPKALSAMNGDGEYLAGEHCKFCKAKAVCRARAEANLELAKHEFKKPDVLSLEEVAEVLSKAEQLNAWAKDVQEYAFDQTLNHGLKVPGYKLVEGRSTRSYTDTLAVVEKLKEAGFDEAVLYEKKLLGITAMEKTIGKKVFAEQLSDLVVKPPGKPTLVPESDKRKAINTAESAVEDFQ